MRRQKYYNIFSINEINVNTTKSLMDERKIYDERIISNWSSIVDPEIASCCVPLKFIYQKNGRILYISTQNLSFFSMFPYKRGLMIQQINEYFGFNDKNTIVDIKIKML